MGKLEFELVPDACWGVNLRSLLPKNTWDFLRKDAKSRANGRCMICGRKTDRLEGHEMWSYDAKNGVQKLEDIMSICHDCHSVIHIGFTQLKGNIERAENHYMKVNNCSYAQYKKELGLANEKHRKLNEVKEWSLDLTFLKQYLNNEDE